MVDGRTREPRRVGARAVVVGASMAGLCAARVLADRFEQVTVLERDELPDSSGWRRQVPQGRHPHLLLVAGARLLEHWFPGLADELAAGGAVDVDLCADVHWYQAGGLFRRPRSDVRGPAMSRPYLEWTVRRRVAALGNVDVRDGAAVDGMVPDADRGRVTGVELADGTTVPADLVVDATGRQARSLPWLEALGYTLPPLSVVEVDMRYVSRVYRRRGWSGDWKIAAEIGDPASKRLVMVLPMEDDRWIMCFAGLNGEVAPTDDAGLVDYARSFELPVFAELAEHGEALGDAVTHRFPANQRRHVERLRRFPVGWVLLGDAVCSFDPIYGQGMTSAAQQAAVLGRELDRAGTVDRRFARRYFRAAGRTVAVPWSTAVGGDFVYEATRGKKPFGTDLVNRYMDRVFVAAQHDDTVVVRTNEVLAMVRRPGSMLTPGFVARVLRASRRGPVGVSAPSPV